MILFILGLAFLAIVLYFILRDSSEGFTSGKIVLVGIGGSGNTVLCRSLSEQNVISNNCNNEEGIKHMSHPSKLPKDVTKVIYVYADPLRSIYSHYRRWDDPNSHFRHLNPKYKHSTFRKFVSDVTHAKKDLSGIEQHFHNWRTAKVDTFLLDFTKINDPGVRNKLKRFIGRDVNLPHFDRERYTKHDPQIRSGSNRWIRDFYDKIYNDMNARKEHFGEGKRLYRLGNCIDGWYFGTLGNTFGEREFKGMDKPRGSIASSLVLGKGVSLKDRSRIAQIDTISKTVENRHDIYHLPVIRLALPEIHYDLHKQLSKWNSGWKKQKYAKRHCVVHYRMGDFIKEGYCTAPESVAQACASLNPKVVEIMDGGKKHNMDSKDPSVELMQRFETILKQRIPGVEIRHSEGQSPDEDFCRMAAAPMIVTTGGSFAIMAVLASRAKEIRTPACLHYLNCHHKAGEEILPHPYSHWRTYDFETLKQ